MMDPTKIAPFDNVDLVILRNFLTLPSFNSNEGASRAGIDEAGEVAGQLETGSLAEVVSLPIPKPP
jgi:hypothetical protein